MCVLFVFYIFSIYICVGPIKGWLSERFLGSTPTKALLARICLGWGMGLSKLT